ncbi:YgfZ/GcvT domain-containing protein [Marinicella meishanensis]|uniref:CAF17-like 4Fe-4S cluster assembly/insertion protein YgfZ n=1 Tax=Marinicella meishanensis TaxID=2873263 RepID=UPI001CBAFF29|nr:hypothetical protein [Marinicella sp. NBU2979]
MNKTTDPSPTEPTNGQVCTFKMTGADGLSFLNNQTLTDLSKHPGQMVYTAICNPKGRLLFSLFLQTSDDGVMVAVDRSLCDNFLQYVTMRRFRLNYALEKSKQILVFDPSSEQPTVSAHMHFAEPTAPPADADQFWSFMFRLGLPWITATTSEAFIPQHLNLEHMGIIDYDKGCYPGQEIVARLHFLGKIKKQMRLINHPSPTPMTVEELQKRADMAGLEDFCSPIIKQAKGWMCQAVFNT